LEEVPQFLDDIIYEKDNNICGILGNVYNNNYFTIKIKPYIVEIKDGSLCKWYYGDSFNTLERIDAKRAFEKISDKLHLPIDKGIVSLIDVAHNFIVKEPCQNYYNHLGYMKNSCRLPYSDGCREIDGIYYQQANGKSLFYNKVKKERRKRQPIPELFQKEHVLRYEQRFKSRLPKMFKVEQVTVASVYTEKFWNDLINRWGDNYFAINKTNDISINFDYIKGKKELHTLGVLSLIETAGGEVEIISQIIEAHKSGKYSKKQAWDLKQAIIDACSEKVGITTKNECIVELDRKVKEAVNYYSKNIKSDNVRKILHNRYIKKVWR